RPCLQGCPGGSQCCAGVEGVFPQAKAGAFRELQRHRDHQCRPGPRARTPTRNPVILFGAIESNPSSGNQNEEFLQLINTNKFAVDVSGWSISGGIRHTLTPGTVIPSGGSLFLSPDSKAFRGRGTGPRGGQGLFVQGGYQGQLSGWGEELVLRDHVGRLIQSTQTQPAPSLAQQSLRIVEILFHPLPPPNSLPSPDPFQFIEILNYGTLPVDLAGVKLVDGVIFEFPRHQPHVIAPNQRVVLVHDLAAFRSRYGPAVPVAGVFSGRLDVGGEKLRLEDSSGEEIQEVAYNDDSYLMPNGGGFALVAEETKTGTRADWGTRAFWTSGSRQGGTPGEPETPRPHLNVVIDEISVRPPIEDVPVMEIRNLGQAPVDVSGWWLSDDPPPGHEKHRVPTNTVLQAGASTTFLKSFLGAGKRIGFSFSSEDDEAVLVATDSSNALNGYGVEMNTRDTFLGGSLRRWVTSDGREWVVPVPVSTIGKPKGPIRVGPVVISEVHYHPVDLSGGVDNEQDEFIEIRNLSDARVNLFNPMEPSLTWKIRGDVDFDFPTNIYLPAKGVLLVVSFDPKANPQSTAQFHQRLGVTPAARLFGPFRGKLNNDSGSIRLVQPDSSSSGEPFPGTFNVVVDEVSFRDAAPWPELADGFGASLHRRILNGFGSEPQNWIAASPSPGRQALEGSAPVITQQPVHAEGALGTPIRLTVTASGSATLHYQWEFEGKAIPGATNSTLSLLNPTQDAEGMYRALVMNGFGYVYSHPASLRFRSPPVITSHPVSRAALIGGSATFRGGAIGVRPLAYQWRRNGVTIPGATTTNLVISPVQNSDFGTYEMIVSDQNGVAVSQTAMLVQSTPPVVIQPPLSLGAVLGETVVISVAVDAPPPLTYRWRRGVTSLVTATLDSTTSFLTLTNFKASDATNYSVIVTNLAGSVSNAFTLTLLPDVDRDGMADEWEVRNGLNTGDPADALLDGDADGRTSREEYLAGTNPKDGSDVLRLDYVGHSRQGYPAFEFKTKPGKTYSVEARSVLGTGRWIRLREHPADEHEQVYWFEDDRDGVGEMFLRIVTPRLP
ncbi:MAG: hypothetical protein FJ405_06115, partial [Verrucomicrobia bacterium]|nr:hypothetical protein [Verrucomicrobiota bacterium]